MSAVATAVIGSAIIGGVVSSSAASKASKAQVEASDKTIAEQRLARDELTRLLAPYTASGIPALQAQMNLIGLGTKSTDWGAYARSNPALLQAFEAQRNPTPIPPTSFGAGPNMDFSGFGGFGGEFGNFAYTPGAPAGGAAQPGIQSLEEFAQKYYTDTGAADDLSQFTIDPQQQAISQIEGGAGFQALARQGEEGILQNASATGGLRGGNVQGALAQFRPALLNQFIEQQYGRLGGMANLGQNSAAKVGAAGQEAATNIGTALGEAGAARAGAATTKGNAFNKALGEITGFGTGAEGKKILGGIF